MKSSIKIPTPLLSIILLVSIITSGGCDADKAWETVDSKAGQALMTLVIVDMMKTFTVGGTVTGLNVGDTLDLLNNGIDELTITGDGTDKTFTFTTEIRKRQPYNVTVLTEPLGLNCNVTNGTGTIVNSEITNVAVECVPE